MSRSRDEAKLLAACLNLLRLRGLAAFRVNAGQLKLGDRLIRLAPAGTSDLIGVLPPSGRFLAIEVKTPTGRLTDAQRAFLEGVTAAGGVSLVVRDLRELETALGRLTSDPRAEIGVRA